LPQGELIWGQGVEKLLPYFSFNGRANRQRYWLTTLAILALYIGGAVVGALFIAIPMLGGLIFLPIVVSALWATLALSTRRLHDRNKSGWWLLPMYVPATFLGVTGSILSNTDTGAGAFFSMLSLPFYIWMLVELGCLKGATGPNRFGDDLLQPAALEVFT
jgi:uncharacterized membrane protein YhaH (DUF805 family)